MTQVLRHLCNKFQNISSSWVLWSRKEAPSFFHSSSPALWLLKFWFYLFFFKLQPIRTGNSAWILIPFWFFFLSCLVVLEEIRAEFASLPFSLEFLTSAKQKKNTGAAFPGVKLCNKWPHPQGSAWKRQKKPKFPFPWKEIYFGVAAFNLPDVQSCWGRILGQNFEEFDLFPSLSHWNFPGFFPPKEHPKTKTAKSPRWLYFYCIF